MLYRDEKFKKIVHREFQILWDTARASKKRICFLGGLAILGWAAVLTQLPPIQRAKSVVPYLVMLGAAHGITKTTKDHFQKTTDIQKRTVTLAKKFRLTHNGDDLYRIHKELLYLKSQFIFWSDRYKD